MAIPVGRTDLCRPGVSVRWLLLLRGVAALFAVLHHQVLEPPAGILPCRILSDRDGALAHAGPIAITGVQTQGSPITPESSEFPVVV
jgi:hypothetical protein